MFIFMLFAWTFSLSACSENTNTSTEQKAKEITNQLTLEEKVGQLFIVRPEALVSQYTTAEIENVDDEHGIKEASDELIENMQKYNLGGFALFAKNIIEPNQTTQMIDKHYDNHEALKQGNHYR